DDKLVYRTGIAVFDRRDPRKVLYRSDEPVFGPELAWERAGQVPNVVFVEGMARKESTWLFYYGGADKYVGVATAKMDLVSVTNLRLFRERRSGFTPNRPRR